MENDRPNYRSGKRSWWAGHYFFLDDGIIVGHLEIQIQLKKALGRPRAFKVIYEQVSLVKTNAQFNYELIELAVVRCVYRDATDGCARF